MRYLATYDGASAGELSEVKTAAVRGCIGAVKAPIVSFTEQVLVRAILNRATLRPNKRRCQECLDDAAARRSFCTLCFRVFASCGRGEGETAIRICLRCSVECVLRFSMNHI